MRVHKSTCCRHQLLASSATRSSFITVLLKLHNMQLRVLLAICFGAAYQRVGRVPVALHSYHAALPHVVFRRMCACLCQRCHS
jgi:hypothetical protein